MEIEMEKLRIKTKGIKPPKLKVWQYLLLTVIAVIALIIKVDNQALSDVLFNLMKP
jgi:hypothetical protein